jgi:acetyl-CoA carboxylase biotin carboxylase subunit
MRIVRDETEYAEAMVAAAREARSAFGDDTMLVEKYVESGRHVEVQVIADAHGHVRHLFERDCSTQRRHQKVLEEAPAPNLPEEVRTAMGEVAVKAALAIGYTNAGTFEFLVDASHRFYFLEMNTRIQVEHPVTELITGVDLVAEQIRVAAGEPLSFSQESLERNGHAVEVRLYAEDPKTFMPSPGQITGLEWPVGEHVRIDTWITADTLVTPHYDPMLAKLVVWGPDRHAALHAMAKALDATRIDGIKTNLPALKDIVGHEDVLAGHYSTSFIATRLAAPAKA